jgi:hypothetical protein
VGEKEHHVARREQPHNRRIRGQIDAETAAASAERFDRLAVSRRNADVDEVTYGRLVFSGEYPTERSEEGWSTAATPCQPAAL